MLPLCHDVWVKYCNRFLINLLPPHWFIWSFACIFFFFHIFLRFCLKLSNIAIFFKVYIIYLNFSSKFYACEFIITGSAKFKIFNSASSGANTESRKIHLYFPLKLYFYHWFFSNFELKFRTKLFLIVSNERI